LISVGLALFIPKIHGGLWSAFGSTAIELLLFLFGLIALILFLGLLGDLKDRFYDWVTGPTLQKKPSVKNNPKTKEPPTDLT